MDYIWEYFCGFDNADVHIRQAEIASPYYEMPPEQDTDTEGIEYNAMYRFMEIFFPILMDMDEGSDMEKWYIDVFSHFLVQVDLKAGLTYGECKRYDLIDKICSGYYGIEMKNIFQRISIEKQYILAHYFVLEEKTEATMSLFSKALIEVLGTGVLYQDKDDLSLYIYYVGKKENAEDKMLVELTIKMLLPLGKRIRVLWDKHFGICNEDITMNYDNIEII